MAGKNDSKVLSAVGQHFIKLAEGSAEYVLGKVEACEKVVHEGIKREISQPLFDALVAHVYSTGPDKPPQALFAAVNAGNVSKIHSTWMAYVTAKDKDGVIKIFPGLVKKRASELQFWSAYEAQGGSEKAIPFVPKRGKRDWIIIGVCAALAVLSLVWQAGRFIGMETEHAVMLGQIKPAQCPVPTKIDCPAVAPVPITPAPKVVHHKKQQKSGFWSLFGGKT